MNCAEVRALFSAYLDKSLTQALRGSVEEHLNGCAKCAADLKGLRHILADLHTMEQLEPPAELRRRVKAQLLQQRAAKAQTTSTPNVLSALASWQSSARAALSYTGLGLASATVVFFLLLVPQIIRQYRSVPTSAPKPPMTSSQPPSLAAKPQMETGRILLPSPTATTKTQIPSTGTPQALTSKAPTLAKPTPPPQAKPPLVAKVMTAQQLKKTKYAKQQSPPVLSQSPVKETILAQAPEAETQSRRTRATVAGEPGISKQGTFVPAGPVTGDLAERAASSSEPREVRRAAKVADQVRGLGGNASTTKTAPISPSVVGALGGAQSMDSAASQQSQAVSEGKREQPEVAKATVAARALKPALQYASKNKVQSIEPVPFQLDVFKVNAPEKVAVGQPFVLTLRLKAAETVRQAVVEITLPPNVAIHIGNVQHVGGTHQVYRGPIGRGLTTRFAMHLKALVDGDHNLTVRLRAEGRVSEEVRRLIKVNAVKR